MDVNNFLLFKQGLIPMEDLNKNVLNKDKFTGFKKDLKLDKLGIDKADSNDKNDLSSDLDELLSNSKKCPSVKEVREFFRDKVEDINEQFEL